MSAPNPFQNIPAELRALKQWVNWKLEKNKNGKDTKVPYQPNGRKASSTDMRTWSTFELVCASNGDLAGRIGFVFTKESGYVGIDLDQCRDKKTGITERWALDIITGLDTYTELSQSGTGWHLIAKGKLPGSGNKVGDLEMYETARFFCSTGTIQNGLGRLTIEQRDVSALHKRMVAKEFVFGKKSASRMAVSESDEDARLIGEVCAESHATNADALEEAFIEKYPERYAERNEKKGDRSGKTYFRYSIERLFEREDDAEPFVPRLPVTETANADRLVVRSGDSIRWCIDREVWCVWDEQAGVWHVNDKGGIARFMQEVSLGIYDEARQAKNLELRKYLAVWAFKSESRSTQVNSIAQARSYKEIEVREFAGLFDTHPMLLNVKNGTVDLRTGKLLAHRRENYLTKIVPIEYDEGAECPDFQKFLAESLPIKEMRDYLWKVFGYCMTGKTGEQKWWTFSGVTNSGKSTTIRILHGLLGPYAIGLPKDFLLITNNVKDFALANLAGCRLATCVETNEGKRLDVAKVKQLTGEDVVTAEKKYENVFSFYSQAKFILVTNNVPHVPASDDATWRRLQLVPFNVRTEEDKIVPELAMKLLEKEAPGILRWAVLGCVEWLKSGLGEPEPIKEASQQYRKDEDGVQHFLDDCCTMTKEPDDEVSRKELYAAYLKWCKDNYSWHVNRIPFAKDCKRLAVLEGVDVRKWYGIRIRQFGDPEP